MVLDMGTPKNPQKSANLRFVESMIQAAEERDMLEAERIAKNKAAAAAKARSQQLIDRGRELDIQKKQQTLARPGYQTTIDGITLQSSTLKGLEQEKAGYRINEQIGTPTSLRADSALVGYPTSVLSKRPEKKAPYSPETDAPPFLYQEKKGKYYVKRGEGDEWREVPKDYYDAQKKYDEQRSEERKKYLTPPPPKKTLTKPRRKHEQPSIEKLKINKDYFD